MNSIQEFRTFISRLPADGKRMPALFVGHGSPMNGIEDTLFSQRWSDLGRLLPIPNAVLVISAHWLTRGTRITAMDFPRTLHDFNGFPEALYQVQYPAPGQPLLARETADGIHSAKIYMDHEWGLDHGAWTVIRHMYPEANIPVLQLSIDFTQNPAHHFSLASELRFLREKGVMIVGSGNMVHNLQMVQWNKLDAEEYGYDWAYAMNEKFKQLIRHGENEKLIKYDSLGPEAELAIPTPDHYIPLLYAIANREKKDEIMFFNDTAIGGSITMTSVLIGEQVV